VARLTVLGARGFVGSRLVRELERRGQPFDAPETADRAALERLLADSPDLGDVVYCIGLTADYAKRPFDTVEAHTSLLARILQRGNFRRLVYLSSTRLYDTLPPGHYAEDQAFRLSPANPRDVYDLSKCLGEWLCLNTAPDRTMVARLACVYDSEEGATGFLPDLLRRLPNERDIHLDSATGFVRDYIHSSDVVEALIRMAGEGTGIVNLGSGRNVSNGEMAAWLNGLGWSVTLARETPLQAAASVDVTRLTQEVGVRPVQLEAFLKEFAKRIPR